MICNKGACSECTFVVVEEINDDIDYVWTNRSTVLDLLWHRQLWEPQERFVAATGSVVMSSGSGRHAWANLGPTLNVQPTGTRGEGVVVPKIEIDQHFIMPSGY
jgi:hypothetical protein